MHFFPTDNTLYFTFLLITFFLLLLYYLVSLTYQLAMVDFFLIKIHAFSIIFAFGFKINDSLIFNFKIFK